MMHLYKVSERPVDVLRRELHMGYTSLYNALVSLERYKLIVERAQGNKRLISLSDKGKRLAEKLWEAEAILQEGAT